MTVLKNYIFMSTFLHNYTIGMIVAKPKKKILKKISSGFGLGKGNKPARYMGSRYPSTGDLIPCSGVLLEFNLGSRYDISVIHVFYQDNYHLIKIFVTSVFLYG